jgi:hypothetical protein
VGHGRVWWCGRLGVIVHEKRSGRYARKETGGYLNDGLHPDQPTYSKVVKEGLTADMHLMRLCEKVGDTS